VQLCKGATPHVTKRLDDGHSNHSQSGPISTTSVGDRCHTYGRKIACDGRCGILAPIWSFQAVRHIATLTSAGAGGGIHYSVAVVGAPYIESGGNQEVTRR
jgi:hypothetical protein